MAAGATRNDVLNSVVVRSWQSDVKNALDGMICLPPEEQVELREMFDALLNSATNHEAKLEIAESIIEFLQPEGYFDLEKSDGLDEWIDADPKVRAAMTNLSEKKERLAVTLKRLMADRGWTQNELAEKLDVTQPTVSAILSGRHKPQPRTLGRLADVFGVEVRELWPE